MQPKPIDRKQIKLIHIAKAQLGLSDEVYRALLMERYDSCFEGSCKELSYQDAHDLLEHFKALGFEVKSRPRPKRPADITALASPQQLAKIGELKADVRWRFRDGLERLCRKIIKKDRPATSKEAGKMIEALKGMKKRQQCEASSNGAPCYRDGRYEGGRTQW